MNITIRLSRDCKESISENSETWPVVCKAMKRKKDKNNKIRLISNKNKSKFRTKKRVLTWQWEKKTKMNKCKSRKMETIKLTLMSN